MPVLAAAGLLVLAFPNGNYSWAAWIAFIPWLLRAPSLSGRAAFWTGYAIGALFFLGSIAWLRYVTLPGMVILSAYLALYVGLFGWLAWRMLRAGRPSALALFGIPSAWVATEFLRSHVLSGFGWNLLAYSQTPWLPAIQAADLAGAWGVSWLVMLGNAALAQTIRARRASAPAAIAAALILGALGYGAWRLRPIPAERTARIAVLQGNIPQALKWDEAHEATIQQTYDRLTRQAAEADPDLIVWPETSVPGFLGLEESVTEPVLDLAHAVGRPLVVGAPMSRLEGTRWQMTNTAALVLPSGELAARYSKIHLVPFGEFVPGEEILPWLRQVLPPIGEFIPGREHTTLDVPPAPLGVLICFEDVFPELARAHVRAGARWLATITNDAWFGPTAAAIQHAQASTLRAVELRVPMVRAANTGWSGCIDDAGRWTARVEQGGRPLFVEGFTVCEVAIAPRGSLYRAWGDWFAMLCLLAAAVGGWWFDTPRRA
jgi:apolipoprotein N-acyltransferase